MPDTPNVSSEPRDLAYELAERWLDDDHGDLSSDEITVVCRTLLEVLEREALLRGAVKNYIAADASYMRRIDTSSLRDALESTE